MKRTRDAARTRQKLLEAAFTEIYRYGFQAASVDRILDHTSVTKGAFFHHFPTKRDLGYAVVDEVIASMIASQWDVPQRASDDPLETILDSFAGGIKFLAAARPNLGCPLNNLAQEMSPIDEAFRRRTEDVFRAWIDTYARAIRRAQRLGQVRKDVDPRTTALYLVAQVEGILSLAKNSQDPRVLRTGLKSMRAYLGTLRVTSARASRRRRRTSAVRRR